MKNPKVYNKRSKNIPSDAVYVGRPSKWGNPYKIGGNVRLEDPNYPDKFFVKTNITREECLNLYRQYIRSCIETNMLNIEELRGKDLVCWCAPKPCHADILLELANKGEQHA